MYCIGELCNDCKPSQRGNDDSEVLKFNVFQGPLTSNSKTFNALFHFQALSRSWKNGEKKSRTFKNFHPAVKSWFQHRKNCPAYYYYYYIQIPGAPTWKGPEFQVQILALKSFRFSSVRSSSGSGGRNPILSVVLSFTGTYPAVVSSRLMWMFPVS